jgi:hypothetical protein
MSVMANPATRIGTDTGSTTAVTELLDRLRLLTDAANRPDLGTHLAQARIRVTDPRLRIVVTGQTGQGMSSLVEAITGAPVTTTGKADPVVVTYSDVDFVRLVPAATAGAEPDAGAGPAPRVEVPTIC